MLTQILRRSLQLTAVGAALGFLAGCSTQREFRTIATVTTSPVPNATLLYVSPGGNDNWSGTLSAANETGSDGPLATLAEARNHIRGMKMHGNGLPAPVTVLLRGGVYPQSETLVFGPEDSGSETCPITYQAFPGEIPVVSGGLTLTGWERDKGEQSREHCRGKLWRVAVPQLPNGDAWCFNQLTVNGERRTRARFPNKGSFYRTDGPLPGKNSRGFYFKEGDIEEWPNLREVIAVVYHSWETSIHHLRSVNTEAGIVTLREPARWNMGRWEKYQRYYLENVFEGLDEPGEWFLDTTAGTLYYYPMPGEKMDSVEAVAPVVTSTLLSFAGIPAEGRGVEHLVFRGISFQDTNANLKRVENPGQGEIYQPGLIMAVGLRKAVFEACEVAHAGAHAIWLGAGCEDNTIRQCHLHDLNGGGVYIGGGSSIQDSAPAQRNTVDNCFIHDAGYLFHGAHGVWIGKSSYNQVTHNEISNLDYSGISCGWSWGFAPTTAHDNNLDYNHIHHLSNGEGLSDMGGIYTLGLSPGTTERYNHIHNVYNYEFVSHGSGIYPDEGSTDILIENNVVHHVRTSPLFMHYGKECLVRNNVFAFGGKGQMHRSREDKRCHYAAEGNIAYGDRPEMLSGPWKNKDWKLGRNTYWCTDGEATFAGRDFAAWQGEGNDEGSIVADPGFVAPEDGDFRLKPDSPALALGFKPIDLSQTGLYGDPEWANLPKKYPNRKLNEILPAVVPPFIVNFDFEADESGFAPLDGKAVPGDRTATLVVSEDTAAGGTKSLKFVDVLGQKYDWTPHIYYKKTYDTGTVEFSWDMLNSREAPAGFYLELREYGTVSPFLVGPTVGVAPDGMVSASGVEIETIPSGTWVHVDIRLDLGEGKPLTYDLTLSVPGRDPVVRTLPCKNSEFRKITWLGIASTSDANTVFYIDNLKLGTQEDLANPLARKAGPARRQARKPVPKDAGPLVGYWTFDDTGDYDLTDSSPYGNHGETWARRAKGTFGLAMACDQKTSNALVADDPSLQFGTGDFSIELWICPTRLEIDSKDKRRRFLSKDDYPHSCWNMNITTEGRPFLEMRTDAGIGCGIRPSGTIPENAWTHLAVVVDRTHGKIRYFFNGALDSEQNLPEKFTGFLDVKGGDLSIGSRWQPFIGLIDELKIYRKALAPDEVKADFEQGKGGRDSIVYELVD